MLLLLFCALASAIIIDLSALYPIVDLGYARYKGIRSEASGVTTWFGIRYALPPTFDLRWRAPVPIHGHRFTSKLLDATVLGPECVQGVPSWLTATNTSIGGDEDCLTVDVLVPNKRSKSMPVWIEIHGGGYTAGRASTTTGYAMVNRLEVVFVQVQYRLGAFGFLDSDDVRKDGTPNAGLLDQRLAMRWVQKYIHAFGGDPSRITISGGSAGGGSVTNHLIMNGDVPFHAAVAEYPWWQPFHDRNTTATQYADLLHNTGCSDLACLRQTPSNVLADAAQKTFNDRTYGYGDFYYGPTVDGKTIPGLLTDQFAAGKFARVPLLTNRETYEGKLFAHPNETMQDLRLVWPNADDQFFASLQSLYPSSDVSTIIGDAFINCGTREIAEAYTKAGLPVWKQIFNAGTQLHAATWPFLFGETMDGSVVPVNTTIGNAMKDWFVSFATHGNPGYWPTYPEVLVVNATGFSTAADPDDNERCDFFRMNGVEILNKR